MKTKYIVVWTEGQPTDRIQDLADKHEGYSTMKEAEARFKELKNEEADEFQNQIFSLSITKVIKNINPNLH